MSHLTGSPFGNRVNPVGSRETVVAPRYAPDCGNRIAGLDSGRILESDELTPNDGRELWESNGSHPKRLPRAFI